LSESGNTIGIRRLAHELDISIGTVSRALNGRPDVSTKTRERVLQAAEALGYFPNQSGRSLRQGTTNTVGFMLESGTVAMVGGDNFFMSVIDGVQSVLARHRLDLIMLPTGTAEEPHDFLQRILARRFVDAMIITATQRQDRRIGLMLGAHVPFVALGRSETKGDYPWIDLDFEGVTAKTIDRLVDHGHRRIALAIPASEVNLGYVSVAAYRNALERHGLPFDPQLILRVDPNFDGGDVTARQLLSLDPRPTAVFLIYEAIANGLYRSLEQAGVAPGSDIAITAFRENPQTGFLSPPLSSFRISLRDLGIALGEALLATMPAYRESYPLGSNHTIWPMVFREGESDGFTVDG
jgi:DNA-binding LacI/PurR family transcriptional regulator